MPPRAGRHRIDPPAAAAKRSTLRPLVIYIYARKRFLQSLALGPPPVPQSPDRRCLVRRSGTESSQTRRWRKPDSNHRYHVARSRFPERLISSLLDFLPTEKLARTRTDTTTMPRALRGTDGSNPASSSSESFSAVIEPRTHAPPESPGTPKSSRRSSSASSGRRTIGPPFRPITIHRDCGRRWLCGRISWTGMCEPVKYRCGLKPRLSQGG